MYPFGVAVVEWKTNFLIFSFGKRKKKKKKTIGVDSFRFEECALLLRRARDLTLHASVEPAAPRFFVYELGESGNMSGEGSTWTLEHFTHSMGKEGRMPRFYQIWNNHVTPLMKLSHMGSNHDHAAGN